MCDDPGAVRDCVRLKHLLIGKLCEQERHPGFIAIPSLSQWDFAFLLSTGRQAVLDLNDWRLLARA